jgi:hypothetical protein
MDAYQILPCSAHLARVPRRRRTQCLLKNIDETLLGAGSIDSSAALAGVNFALRSATPIPKLRLLRVASGVVFQAPSQSRRAARDVGDSRS